MLKTALIVSTLALGGCSAALSDPEDTEEPLRVDSEARLALLETGLQEALARAGALENALAGVSLEAIGAAGLAQSAVELAGTAATASEAAASLAATAKSAASAAQAQSNVNAARVDGLDVDVLALQSLGSSLSTDLAALNTRADANESTLSTHAYALSIHDGILATHSASLAAHAVTLADADIAITALQWDLDDARDTMAVLRDDLEAIEATTEVTLAPITVGTATCRVWQRRYGSLTGASIDYASTTATGALFANAWLDENNERRVWAAAGASPPTAAVCGTTTYGDSTAQWNEAELPASIIASGAVWVREETAEGNPIQWFEAVATTVLN